MKPVKFEGVNLVLNPPPGMEGTVVPLYAHREETQPPMRITTL